MAACRGQMQGWGHYLIGFYVISWVCLTQVRADSNTIPPSGRRSRDHVERMLQLDKPGSHWLEGPQEKKILDDLAGFYRQNVRPVEEAYKFSSLQKHVVTEGEIHAKPMILFLGPWSTGKTTMINYLLGLEGTKQLHTGAEPTTRDFTVIEYGDKYKTAEGMVLLSDYTKPYTPLQKFGLGFAERLTEIELPSKLLERVTIIDTPGILENRKQQERGYPFNDVCQWLINRAALIFVVFDPTKLDVGTELDKLFQQLKGKQSQIRLILNKADTIQMQELMRVYGALFWSLAPLVNLIEPPRIYVGSFWQKSFREDTIVELFFAEELSLLNDLNQVIKNQIETKISFIRQHAILVRIHALLLDRYLASFSENKGLLFGDSNALKQKIIDEPHNFPIYKNILGNKDISKQDLPDPVIYKDFFSIHPLDSFFPLSYYCPLVIGRCMMSKLESTVTTDLPQLLLRYQKLHGDKTCDSKMEDCSKPKQTETPQRGRKPVKSEDDGQEKKKQEDEPRQKEIETEEKKKTAKLKGEEEKRLMQKEKEEKKKIEKDKEEKIKIQEEENKKAIKKEKENIWKDEEETMKLQNKEEKKSIDKDKEENIQKDTEQTIKIQKEEQKKLIPQPKEEKENINVHKDKMEKRKMRYKGQKTQASLDEGVSRLIEIEEEEEHDMKDPIQDSKFGFTEDEIGGVDDCDDSRCWND